MSIRDEAIKALQSQAWAKRAEDSKDFAELDAMMEEEGLDFPHDEYVIHCREVADLMTAEVLNKLGGNEPS